MATTITTGLVLGVVLCTCLVASYKYDRTQESNWFKVLSRDRKLYGYRSANEVLRKSLYLEKFHWKNCGSSSDPTQLKSLTLSPDPLPIPGNFTLGFSVYSNVPLRSPLKIEMLVKKKELVWIEIPCVESIGSCTYTDICQFLTTIQVCPEVLVDHGIQCLCPYNAGTYTLPPSEVIIGSLPLPEWLSQGQYQITAKFSTNGQPLGCIEIYVTLADLGKRPTN